MDLVILESPYAGDVEKNLEYGRAALRDSLLRGEAPIASHLLYTQPGVLDDLLPQERQHGIDAGLAWRKVATKSVVYEDLGISKGMQYGIEAAKAASKSVEFRKILTKPEAKMTEPTTGHRPQKPTIEFAQLEALDIRMCRIESVEPILKNPKKDPSEDNPVKAYKLVIDTGLDKRECATNLIEYTPEDLLGVRLPFILNLPTATIRGVESKAMMVAADGGNARYLLKNDFVQPGDRVF